MKTKILAFLILFLTTFSIDARVDPEKLKKMKDKAELSGSRMDCEPPEAQYVMEINNVRARLLTGGDLWWDLQQGGYIVPKPAPGFPEVSGIFASGIWIGGVDPNGALKLAGVTYRSGNATDFYAGPLDDVGQTNDEECNNWDRHFVVLKTNILIHQENYQTSIDNNEIYACDSIPDDVKYWPARGNPFFGEEYDFDLPDQNLAEFYDDNGDGIYNPCMGDFPILQTRGCEPIDRESAIELIPDEVVFWIFNDNGGPHILTQASSIQMEIHATAYAYQTGNEINDMTFYKFKMINKASDDIRDSYFGLWVDADLGCSEDDYIGCDVDRSLAYVYNEDDEDGSPGTSCPGGVETYGTDIPILGIDFFRGPRGPKVFCGIDADGNQILCDPEPGTGQQDTLVELGMTSFIYQNRGIGEVPEATKDPEIDFEFYNILKGLWKDGTPITIGGMGFDPASADTVKYVFYDPPSDNTGWSMCVEQLPFDDRRTVQSTGPFLLQPGAKNEMMFGVVFVPDADYPCPSIERLQYADDLAQSLFDNCFGLQDTPDAPDMTGVELDRQLILHLSNDDSYLETNNVNEEFMEHDLQAPEFTEDSYYRFEGYKIYQLENPNVSNQELNDFDKARLIRQVDVQNGVGDIYNWFPIPNPDPNVTSSIWIPELQVSGSDEGIQHTFNILEDAFSEENLLNNKEYYFTVVAYAYNNYKQYDVSENTGQRKPYIESDRNRRTYSFKPRSLNDVDVPTIYGQEVPITRIQGIGTSFNALDMVDGEIESILDGSFDGEITYKVSSGPINPKVVDPLSIKDGRYRLEIIGDYNDAPSQLVFEEGAMWRLTDITTGEVIASDKSIDEINEQIIEERGFSLSVNQSGNPGDRMDANNGGLAQYFEYKDSDGIQWWNAIPADDGIEVTLESGNSELLHPFVGEDDEDPGNPLSKMGSGQFIPLRSAKWTQSEQAYITPGWKSFQGFAVAQDKLIYQDLNNVDIVFTPDKSKWSQCIVVESAVEDYLVNGLSTRDSKTQFELRSDSSIDENGNDIGGTGMSYFPGYAIDVETGERLNIFFGENSVFNTDNDAIVGQSLGTTVNSGNIGADMLWNPSNKLFTEGTPDDAPAGSYSNLVGGQHYIYVTRQEYDGCASLHQQLGSGGLLNKINGVSFITWTAIPLPQEPLLSLEEGLIPSEVTVKLRVTNPFNKEIDIANLTNPQSFEATGGLPVYEFGFEDLEFTGTLSTEESSLFDDIVISPNPIYEGQSSNVARISNLPQGSQVTVYSLEGKFVKQFDKEEGSGEIQWDLRDNNGIRVSKGVFVIHVAIPHLNTHKAFKMILL